MKRFILRHALGLCAAGALAAQSASSLPLNLESSSARSAALGQSLAAPPPEEAAFSGNPAALGFQQPMEIQASHQALWQGLTRDEFKAAWPMGAWGGLSLGLRRLDYGSFEGRDALGQRSQDYSGSRLGASPGMGLALASGLALGANLNWDRVELAGELFQVASADLGLSWRPGSALTLGAVLSQELMNPSGPASVATGRMGLCFDSSSRNFIGMLASVEGVLDREGLSEGRAGLELRAGKFSALRAGARIPTRAAEKSGRDAWTLGLGLRWASFGLDYAWVPSSELGAAHQWSLSFKGRQAPPPKPQALPDSGANSLPGYSSPIPLSASASGDEKLRIYFGFANDPVEKAKLLEESGDFEGAAEAWEAWRLQDPKDPRAPASLGRLYLLLGKKEEALRALEEATLLNPEDMSSCLLLEKQRLPAPK